MRCADSKAAVLLPERFRAGCAFGGRRLADATLSGQPAEANGPSRSFLCDGWRMVAHDPSPAYCDSRRNLEGTNPYSLIMTLLLRLSIAVLALMLPHAPTRAADSAVQQLHQLFERAWQEDLQEDPVYASYLGDNRYNAQWRDWSEQAQARARARHAGILRELGRIDRAALPPPERLNQELFRRLYAHRIALYDFGARHRPLDQLNYSGSIQTLSELTEVLSFEREQNYLDWIARLRDFGALMDQVIALARTGIKTRNVQPCIIVERTLGQVKAQRVAPEASPFFKPFTAFPASIPLSRQDSLRREGLTAVRDAVLPAFARLERFIIEEYLPASRMTVGIWDTPKGEQYYQHCLEWFTTTSLTAEQIHQIGVAEVARIRSAMNDIIAKVEFKGTFLRFLEYLRTDPRFHYSDPQRLLEAYTVMAKRIDPLLPRYFGRLPRTPYGVREIPASTAPDTTTAYYQPSSADGRRPGYFYVNLYRPEQRPKYEIPVLTAHEAVPGHHIQQALAQEAGELPNFRRDFDATAFVEGWALYAEHLGDEMGLYADPYDKFGQLTYEMWRAARLVVDTGIHHKRWTREQAIAFFKENTAKSELDIVNEVDCYIAWPGQATAYKIGELKIKELRHRAQQRLGERFDLREFHDEILSRGAVPLDILERMMNEWIERKTDQNSHG
jgi:uncharacterized protein (DUF885 family)